MRSKKIARALCWALLGALVLLIPTLPGRLPAVNEGLAADAYDSWAGVLRVWVCGGWTPGGGSFVPWLNGCATRFEKRHAGVYVQIQSVSEHVLAAYHSGAINPPDVILFAPGMLASGEGLCVLSEPESIRRELDGAGWWQDGVRAVPVAMGGYAWAINQSMLQAVPYDWSMLKAPDPVRKQERYLMHVPADQPYLNWSAALNALCSPRTMSVETRKAPRARQGIDLNLPIEAEPTPTPEPAETELVLCRLPEALPSDFRAVESAFYAFTQGVVAAIPVTQREIRRLQQLSDSGRAPSWTVEAGGGAFSDQLLMGGVVDVARPDGEARKALSVEWLMGLLGEDAQAALVGIRALRVTAGEPLYATQMGMAELELAYGEQFWTVNAFDRHWRDQARAEADRLVRESKRASPTR